MPEKYGTHERATLIALLTAGTPLLNTELVAQGIELRPTGRAKLNAAGLIKSATGTRPFVHEITEDGVAWCLADLADSAAPARSGPLVRQWLEVLGLLVDYFRRTGGTLDDLVGKDLEALIREVYAELSVKPQDWVRLARLRPRIDAGKAEVDEVLLRMVVERGDTHLAPDSNRKVLTADDHAAAIRVGSEDKHLMAIEES